MEKYIIEFGVGGGYNDIQYGCITAENECEAGHRAYEEAAQLFDNYGIGDDEDLYSEDCDDEERDTIYLELIDSWCVYGSEPWTQEREDYLKDRYHYTIFDE